MLLAAMDAGWNIALEKDAPDDEVRGLTVGTQEYLDKIFDGEKSKGDISE